ncbi:hypothetical protein ACIQPR_29630 [Streptomyces sp. NPDC091280]|uniref:hypothetical protein n=1 Tax=Streptomyces sp. NPDC091280 TaxID=3365984 RepID=UPI0038051C3E
MAQVTSVQPRRGGRPVGCLGALALICLVCVLLAAGVVVWFFQSVRDNQRDQDRAARGAVVAAAERLRTRLENADADGTLTDREITQALGQVRARSVDRGGDRAVLVVQIAASSWAQCYSYTALPTGAVTARPLKECGG